MNLSHFHTFSLAALISVAAFAVRADTTELADGRITYEIFEHAVEHVDLATCPAEFDTETQFCRMTLADDRAHVFVFSLDGDQVLAAVKSYDLSDGLPQF